MDTGAFEMEYGCEYVAAKDKEYNHSLAVKAGILKDVDLGFEAPYQFLDLKDSPNHNGFSDFVISSKWNILKDQSA